MKFLCGWLTGACSQPPGSGIILISRLSPAVYGSSSYSPAMLANKLDRKLRCSFGIPRKAHGSVSECRRYLLWPSRRTSLDKGAAGREDSVPRRMRRRMIAHANWYRGTIQSGSDTVSLDASLWLYINRTSYQIQITTQNDSKSFN